VLHDTNSQNLLAVVAPMHHEGVGQTLNNGAVGLAETLDIVASCSVGKIGDVSELLLHSQIVLKRDVPDGNIVESPTIEELDLAVGCHEKRERKERGRKLRGTPASQNLLRIWDVKKHHIII